MSLAISVENVSKIYRLGEINRSQFFADLRRWAKSKFNPDHTFGDPETEAEQEPKAPDLFYALSNISFEIKQGETVGIIGSNGAGKSTLLKLISRITAPSSGIIKINGRVGSLLEVGTGFHPDLTGRDNMFMNGAILGMNRREVAAKFDDIVSFSGVGKFIDTPVKRYSSGMFVRLAFSVAAFLEPEILIVDEVLSVGDQQFQDRCIQRLKEIIRDGRTVLFVSHGAGVVKKICNRAILLKDGKVVLDDEPFVALAHYQKITKDSEEGTKPSNSLPATVRRDYSQVSFSEGKAPGSVDVQLTGGRLLNEGGTIIDRTLTSKGFILEFDFRILKNSGSLRPAAIFSTVGGDVLFWSGDASSGSADQLLQPGDYRTRLFVPAHLLAPGEVVISFDIGENSNKGNAHAQATDELKITIEDDLEDIAVRGAYSGPLPGCMRPLLKWSTEKAN